MLHKQALGVTDEVMKIFMLYDWPGNVRELEHVIEGAMNVMEGRFITAEDISYQLQGIDLREKEDCNTENLDSKGLDLKSKLEKMEERYIRDALEDCHGNITVAAKILGIPRQTLQYKKMKYDL